jgi:hypothetical protein
VVSIAFASACAFAAPATAFAADEHAVDTSSLKELPTADNTPKPSVEEAPPPPPHKKGVVLESNLGALGFIGQFRKVAPPGPWLDLHGGYELFSPLLVFLNAELFYTDTENAQNPPKTHAFPVFAFGTGARGTFHITEHVALFLEGNVGFMKADIATGALKNLGYKDAEALNLYFGGHLGAEWYMIDRHLALGVLGGVRDLTGFKRQIGNDTPLAWDGAVSLRYTF